MANSELLEKLSELEHKQWEAWAKTTIKTFEDWIEEGNKIGDDNDITRYFHEKIREQIEKWKVNIKPYAELSDDVKEFDRKWARKVFEIVHNVND